MVNINCDEDGVPNSLNPYSHDEVGSISTTILSEAVSPNGDGINDNWVVQGIEGYPNSNVNVYNRSGREVFSAINYQNDWSSNYNDNREKLPAGSQYYVINLDHASTQIDGWIFINY